MTDDTLKIHSDIAWNIASQWSWTLASDTRTLAAQIDDAIFEARSAAKAEAYAIRLKKNRSGCACHINDEDEIVSMCLLHKELIDEAHATGRIDGLREASKIANEIGDECDWIDGKIEAKTIAAAIRVAMENKN